MVFDKQYSDLYDRFYQDKDYASECDLIEDIFRKYSLTPHTLLDLGCGTGGHALHLSRRGYQVTGIDRSEHMLKKARKKASDEDLSLEFLQQDICQLDLEGEFDAVMAMFAVIGYLNTNEDLEKAFGDISRLRKKNGGIFIFDCWYGPAVLQERPESRIKHFFPESDRRILRLVIPELDANHHLVRVNYQVMDIAENRIMSSIRETHSMRFFFPRELEYFLTKAGFKAVDFFPFGDLSRELKMTDWNMLVIAR